MAWNKGQIPKIPCNIHTAADDREWMKGAFPCARARSFL